MLSAPHQNGASVYSSDIIIHTGYYKSATIKQRTDYDKTIVNNLYMIKEANAAKHGVSNHPIKITKTVFLLMVRAPLTRPTPTTAPTIAADDDTGIPIKTSSMSS